MSQPLPTAQRYNTLRNRWAFPRMADNCTLPMISGTPSLSYKVLALFDMLPRAPITIGITVTFEVPWILLISNAISWYFSTFSSSVLMMFWSAGTAMSIRVHFCVSLCTRVITGRLCFNTCLCRKSCPRWLVLLHFLQLVRVEWWSYHLSVHPTPYFLNISQWTLGATLAWRFLYSFWVSFLHLLTMCHTISVDSPHNLHSGVSEVVYTLCLKLVPLEVVSSPLSPFLRIHS